MTKRTASAALVAASLGACAQIVDAGFDGVSLGRPHEAVAPFDAASDQNKDLPTESGGRVGGADSSVDADSGGPSNAVPQARDETVFVVQGFSKRGSLPSFDADGDVLTHALAEMPPRCGTVKVEQNGAFEYSPDVCKYGTDSFRYQVSDGKASAVGTMHVTVVALGPLKVEPPFDAHNVRSFGSRVAIDGDTAVARAWDDAGGVVYVLRRDADGSWSRHQRIQEEDGRATALGMSYGDGVALSGDWLAVTASAETGSPNLGGVAYFYKRSSKGAEFEWKQTVEGEGRGIEDAFGTQLALDGDVAVIGAYADPRDTYTDGGAHRRFIGALYVFRRQSDDEWLQEQRITAPNGETENSFGWSLGFASGLLVASAFGPEEPVLYPFRRTTGGFSPESSLTPYPVSGGSFGASIALHGNNFLVASPNVFTGGDVYAFTRVNSTWRGLGIIEPPSVAPGVMSNVALHGDTAIVTKPSAHPETGAAFVYHFKPTTETGAPSWQYSGPPLTGPAHGGRFGSSVAFDGTTAAIAAPYESGEQGAVYFFGIPPQEGD